MKRTKELIAFRIDQEMLERLDELVPLFSTSWREGSRSDALRAILYATLEAVEHDDERVREIVGAGRQLKPNDDAITAWMASRKKKGGKKRS